MVDTERPGQSRCYKRVDAAIPAPSAAGCRYCVSYATYTAYLSYKPQEMLEPWLVNLT